MRSTGNQVSIRTQLRWRLWRLRYAVVAGCVGIAAAAGVAALRDPGADSVPVLVAARDLPAGALLVAGDLAVRQVPAGVAPSAALTDPGDALDRMPLVNLPAALPITPELLSGNDTASLAPPDTAVVPVRLDPAAATLLRPGDRVDLIATSHLESGAEPVFLARRALVLPDVGAVGGGGITSGLLGGGGSGAGQPVTLVAVAPDDAPGLSAVSLSGSVAAILVQ